MKFKKALFVFLGLAFLVSIGSLIGGQPNQEALIIRSSNTTNTTTGTTENRELDTRAASVLIPNSAAVSSPLENADIPNSSQFEMACDYTLDPQPYKIVGAYYVYSTNTAGQFFTLEGNNIPSANIDESGGRVGRYSRTVSVPSMPDGRLGVQCVAYFPSGEPSFFNTSYDVDIVTGQVVDTQAPTTPGIPSLLQATSSSLNIQWAASTDNVGVEKYNIYRNSGGNSPVYFVDPIGVVNGSTTSYLSIGLQSNRKFKYQVRAFDAAGNMSALSPLFQVTTPMVQPPSNVSIIAPTTSSLTVQISPSPSTNIFQYEIYANTGGGSSIGITPIVTINHNDIEAAENAGNPIVFTHQNLNQNTTYSYQVRALDDAHNKSSLTTVKTGTTLTASVPSPSVPSMSVSGVTQNSVSLTWPVSTGVAGQQIGYKIFKSSTSSGTYTQVNTSLITTNNFTDTGLNPSNNYYYKAQACYIALPTNCSNQSSYVMGATIAAPDTTAPNVPANLQVTSTTTNSISLSWSASTDTGGGSVAGYKLFRSSALNGTYSLVGSQMTQTSYINIGLNQGSTYYYKVQACDNAPTPNCSALSATPASGATLSAPNPPSNVTVGSPTTTSLNISWTAPTTPVTSYRIYRVVDGVVQTPYLTQVNSPNLNHTVQGLTSGTTYSYRVSSVNSVGESALSPAAPASATGTTSSPQIVVNSINLVQATGGTVIQNITGGQTINIGTQGNGVGQNISMEANTNPAIAGSVKFTLTRPDGVTYETVENNAPYTLFGDTSATTFNPWQGLQVGGHTLLVTPYSGAGATGQVGIPKTVQFQIVNNDDTTPPANPTNVAVVYRSSSQMKLTWTNSTSTDVASYKVYRNGVSIGIAGATEGGFTDASSNATSVYTYKVTAVDGSNNEAALPTSSVTSPTLSTTFSINNQVRTTTDAQVKSLPEGTGGPLAPNGTVGTISNGPVWISNSGVTFQFWFVNFSSSLQGWVREDQLAVATQNTATITAPVNGSTAAAGSTIPMTCNYSTSPKPYRITGFYYVYSGGATAQLFDIFNSDVPSSGTYTTNITLPAGVTSGTVGLNCAHYFATGEPTTVTPNPGNDITISGGGNPITAPSVPNNVTVGSPTAGSLTLNWTAPTSGSAVTEYRIYRSAAGSTTVGTTPIDTVSGTTLSYLNTGLAASSSYTYKVSAYNSAGQSALAPTAGVTGMTSAVSSGGSPVVTTPQRSFTPNQVAIIVNSANPISSSIANYYATQRGIPTSNIITVNLGNADYVSSSSFNTVRTSIINSIASKPEIQTFAFAGEKPFMVKGTTSDNCANSGMSCMSISSALAMGYSSSNTGGSTISSTTYFGTDSLTPRTSHNYIPTSVLAGRTLAEAQGFIQNGKNADNTYPSTAKVYNLQTGDSLRSGARRPDMMNTMPTIFNSGEAISSTTRDSSSAGGNMYDALNYFTGQPNMIGYHTGSYLVFNIDGNTILPGALADHVTSFGGYLTDTTTSDDASNGQFTPVRINEAPQAQMVLTNWLSKGFTMSAGTVQEPWCCNSVGGLKEKFALPSKLWETYYTGGSAVQSFANSIQKPGQTLIAGELLANPWKDPQITYSNNTLTIKITHIKPGETWKLQSSTNGTSWVDVSGQTSITSPGGKLGLKTITATNATAPYYRLLNTNNTSLPQIQRSFAGGGGVLPTAPSAPTGVSGSAVSSSQINVAWTDTSNNELTFTLERASNSSFTSPTVVSGAIPAGTTSYSVSGLGAGQEYFFRVKAVNAAGSSTWANSAGVTTSSAGGTGGGQVLGLMGMAGPDNSVNATPSANPFGRQDYFVSCLGNDSNNGTSVSTPWKTITKLNALTSTGSVQAGTRVMFKRDCSYYGSIKINSSGTASQPIEFNAYGTGSAPIIKGTIPVSTWTLDFGNIWKANVGTGLYPRYLFSNDSLQDLAQTPNAGSWFYTDSRTGTTTTDSEIANLPSGSLNGVEYVMRKSPWEWNIMTVNSHSGNTITHSYDGIQNGWAGAGWPFAFINKKSFLNAPGEWFYDSSNGYVYFQAPGNVNPNTLSVELSKESFGFDPGSNKEFLTVKNLEFQGYKERGVRIEVNPGLRIENVEVTQSATGILGGIGLGNPTSKGAVLKNNYIHDIYGTDGLYFSGDGNSLIEGNVIERVFLNPLEAGPTSSGQWANGFGLRVNGGSSHFTVRGNKIKDTGYIGLVVSGKSVGGVNSLVEKNLVETSDMTANDGGGISFDFVDGVTFKNNIVKDTKYEIDLMPLPYSTYKPIAHDYYFGNTNIKNVKLENNVSINSSSIGIWRDSTLDNTNIEIRDNLIYNAADFGIGLSLYSVATAFPGGCNPTDNSPCYIANYNDVWSGNKVYQDNAAEPTVYQLQVYSNGSMDTTKYGTWTGNYFFNPFKSNGRTFQEHRLFNPTAWKVGDPIEVTSSTGVNLRGTNDCVGGPVLGVQPLGSVATVTQIFGSNCLGVTFENGQSGWVYKWGGLEHANRNIAEWRTYTSNNSTNKSANYTTSNPPMPPLYINETNSPVNVNIGSGKCDSSGQALPSTYTLSAFADSIVPETCSLQIAN